MIGAIKGFPYFWKSCPASVISPSICASSAATPLPNSCPRFSRFNYRIASKFFPESSEILSFYSAADIYVAPSLEDSFNLPVLEAMACGLPVVVSRHAGISEYIVDGVDGILLDAPEDSRALAGSLTLLLQQPELRLSLGENASRKAMQFSWDRQAEAVHVLLVGSEPQQ